MYGMKHSGSALPLAVLLVVSCGAEKSGVGAKSAEAQRQGATEFSEHAEVPSRALDPAQDARERLGMLQREMLRVASRLEREGSADQRAHWQDI
jgi:hypothetical protein